MPGIMSVYPILALDSTKAFSSEKHFTYIFIYLVYVVCLCLSTLVTMHCVELRGQLVNVGSLPPPCVSQELNSVCQAWWQASVSARPSCWFSEAMFNRLAKGMYIGHPNTETNYHVTSRYLLVW